MSNFQRRSFILLIALLIIIGAVVHLLPLSSQERMSNSISDDGYLMMTIARNMTLGMGMSIAEGTIPTNGTQPLTTALWALGYWLLEGDKIQGIAWVIVMHFIIASLAAFLLWQGSKRLLQQRPHAGMIAVLTAATWYASPILLGHTMNGLETGLYTLCIIGVAIWFSLSVNPWTMRRSIGLGLLLGITFWVRNDAALFIFAACVTHLFLGAFSFDAIKQRFWQVFVMGATSVVIAIPWLLNNYLNFDSIMPISGQSQSLVAGFADNLPGVPALLVEYLFVFLPLPHVLEKQMLVKVICVVILLIGFGLLIRQSIYFQAKERRLVMLISIYTVCLVSFYGLFFGAANFLPRYFFPTTPFFVLVWASVVVFLWQRVNLLQRVMPIIAVLFMSVVISLHARAYLMTHQTGGYHQYLGGYSRHFQLAEWVQQNVSTEVWVGSWQSGTVGYFHDRTINLDGKTNPEALAARKKRQLPEYMVEKGIQYFIDWASFAVWMEKPILKTHFDLIVKDRRKNLVVQQRKNAN